MTLEEYVNKRVAEVDDIRELAKELLTYYYEGWDEKELYQFLNKENNNDNS